MRRPASAVPSKTGKGMPARAAGSGAIVVQPMGLEVVRMGVLSDWLVSSGDTQPALTFLQAAQQGF